MSKRFKDFDAAQDSKNPEPIKIKVNGNEMACNQLKSCV